MKKQFTLIAWITLIMTLLLSSCQKFEGDAIQKLAYGKDESGRHFVDLGLSVKWATCNIGAEAPEQQGLLYAWGETSPKEEYTWDNYKFGPDTALSKYCAKPDVAWHGFTDAKTTLELSDDAAHVNWQGRWRMPTQAEWNELIEKCTWTQTEYMGVKGYDVKASNGNRIFLPAPDENALYASSSLIETRPGEALHLPIFDQYDVLTAQYRYRAYSVRAVYGPVLPQYCLITFDANGGEGIMHPQQFSLRSASPLTEVRFTKQASVFSSWNTKADGSGTSYKDKASIITDKSFTIYAQWTPCHTITFDANGGEGTMDSLTIVSGTKKPLPANTFTRPGYVFAAWNTKADGSGTAYKESSEIAPTENMTLYAQWTPCYTITFDANGGEGTMDSLTIVQGEECQLPANTFTRNGYVFAGWNTKADGSGTAYKESSEIAPTQNMTLYAQWTPCYTITFDANGGEGTMDSLTIVQGEECQLPANTFTRNGYVFAGWNTKADGSGSTYNESSKIAPTQNMTLYAQWTPCYTITFDANGGKGRMAPQKAIKGEEFSISSNVFTRADYTFTAWNTKADGSGTSYVNNQVIILSQDITLYAQWMEGYYESGYEYVDLGLPSGTKWATYNVGATKPEEFGDYFAWGETEPKTNYTWSTYKHCNGSSTSLTKYNPNSSYGMDGKVDSKTTLDLTDDAARINWGGRWRMPTKAETKELVERCTWKETTQSGVKGFLGTSKANGKSIFLPNTGFYEGNAQNTREGWSHYWTNSLDDSRPDNALMLEVSDDHFGYGGRLDRYWGASVRAVFSEKDAPSKMHTIIFNANGGSGTMLAQQIMAGLFRSLSPNTFIRSGYTFVGWNTAPDGSGTSYTDKQVVSLTEDITLYAQWEQRFYVTFEANGGTGEMEVQTFVPGETKALLACDFSNSGYMFTGWNTEADGSGTSYSDKQIISVTQDLTLYAQWKRGVYTVSFDANGGSGTMSAQTFEGGVSQALAVNSFVRAGYSFINWNTLPDGSGTSYTNLQKIVVSQDLTLYAQWKKIYFYVTFDANGGEGSMPAQEFEFDVSQSLNTNLFTRYAYIFNGWNTKADGSGHSYADGEFISTDKHLTLYAQWKLDASFGEENGYVWVDLGLPSGLKWATCNVGASSPDGYGDYFAWGETSPKNNYDWSTYKYMNNEGFFFKYNYDSSYGTVDEKTTLELSDDVARANWGGKWRMPTKAEQEELIENCIWTWTSQNGVNGCKVTSKNNGNSIFLPAAGVRAGSSVYNVGSEGCYWSSQLEELYDPEVAYSLRLDDWGAKVDDVNYRRSGLTVRAVILENEVIITFDSNGGTGNMAPQKNARGEKFALHTNTFTRDGYTFVGWNTKADGSGTSYTDMQEISLTRNTTLFAQWKPYHEYYVTFDANGGEGEMEPQLFLYGIRKPLMENSFTREGYVFVEWNREPDGSGSTYQDQELTSLYENITLYAQWAKSTYTLTFDANGGEGSMPAQKFEYGVSQSINTNLFTRYAYIFNGWNTKADGSGHSYADGEFISTDKHLTLYAQWKLDASFGEENGYVWVDLGLPSGLKWATCNVGATTPENSGDYFAWGETSPKNNYDWSTYKYCKGSYNTMTKYCTDRSYGYNGFTDNKTTLELSDDAAHTNWGGKWRMPTITEQRELIENCTWTWTTQNGVNGLKVTSKTNGNNIFLPAAGSRSGTSVDGVGSFGYYWPSSPDERCYAFGLNFNSDDADCSYVGSRFYGHPVRAVILENEVIITFDSNGGTGNMAPQINTRGEKFALHTNTFTRDGYTFVGWNTKADGSGTSYTDMQEISLTRNTTLFAQWKPYHEYYVTFDANGGEGSMPAQEFEYGVSQALNANGFTRANYAFIGWNTAPNGSGTLYTDQQEISITQDITLYAQWEKATYMLTFDANGGEGSMPAQKFEYGVSQSINTNLFTRDGYVFNGWNTASNGNGTSYTDQQEITLTQDITLYAQWKLYASSGEENGYVWVDLGLPSGLKWATCNVGAATPEGYGDYFAWGETSPKANYTWETYKFRTSGDSDDNVKFNKYNTSSDHGTIDNKTTLDLSDDAARANWGGKWRMPTKAEQDELRNNCTWTWTTQNGVNGHKITSITNGNSIFLPAAGARSGTYVSGDGSSADYWSNSLEDNYPYCARYLFFHMSYVLYQGNGRDVGRTVRAVCP